MKFLFAVLLLLPLSWAVKFELPAQEVQCFDEELPGDLLVTGTFKAPKLYNQDLEILIFGPGDTTILKQSQTVSERFAFTSQVAGDHRICFRNRVFSNQGTSLAGTMIVELQMRMGSFAVDYEEIATKEGLKGPVDVEIRRMVDSVNDLHADLIYMRGREETMRNTNESTNSRVMGFSVLSIFILISMGIWQILYLRRYFLSRHIGGVGN
ncbi:putative emp24/gp25L/p24 family protein [Paratrimastix pyriformis]|uniref:Emp24/gp25L/p24 family protein n=1 Tax=Paratrimastix pyriformis TaxID=342808 RepID=A0ABQ8UFQ6_9EUKA|nr:putative emp24/gp25L/p24 family protein [Paratrimastix pyriformis]